MSDHSPLPIDSLAALCGAAPDFAVVLSALFLAGLAGGVSHCAGMCGPFVVTQVSQRLAAVEIGEFGRLARLKGAALLPYHLGRATIYAGLGAAAAWATGQIVSLPGFRWLSAAFLLAAAALFIGSLVMPGRWLSVVPAAALSRVGPGALPARLVRALFRNPRGFSGYALGLALGFLPCGLVYSALAAAAAGGDPRLGALGMAVFAAGTFPALFAVGYGSVALGRRWRAAVSRLAKPLMAVNAALLVVIAVRDLF